MNQVIVIFILYEQGGQLGRGGEERWKGREKDKRLPCCCTFCWERFQKEHWSYVSSTNFQSPWPSPHPCQQINISGWGAEGCNADLLCRLPFICLPRSGCHALLQGSKAPSQSSLISPLVRRLPWVQEHFLLHSSLPEVQAPSSSFLFPALFVLFSYMEVFLSFQKSKVFCWCSVAILCESFHL